MPAVEAMVVGGLGVIASVAAAAAADTCDTSSHQKPSAAAFADTAEAVYADAAQVAATWVAAGREHSGVRSASSGQPRNSHCSDRL